MSYGRVTTLQLDLRTAHHAPPSYSSRNTTSSLLFFIKKNIPILINHLYFIYFLGGNKNGVSGYLYLPDRLLPMISELYFFHMNSVFLYIIINIISYVLGHLFYQCFPNQSLFSLSDFLIVLFLIKDMMYCILHAIIVLGILIHIIGITYTIIIMKTWLQWHCFKSKSVVYFQNHNYSFIKYCKSNTSCRILIEHF